ncbi:transglycosylase domain-containing protein [Streptomyces sp. NPDC058231]|uniref:transglycosylase domain-containing protein n=1 Tax=Streptomyces sp. NPDC058231 TaxID=3346392 RepID=UPI0036E24293
MSEHRRKTPQPQGGGRAAARRAAQQSSGRRAAPSRGVTSESPSDPYGDEAPYGGRAEARRAAQRGGGNRRAAEGGGAGHGGGGGRRRGGGDGGHEGPGRGRGRGNQRPVKKRFIDYPRAGKYGFRRWMPSWRLVSSLCIGFLGLLMGLAGLAYAMVATPKVKDAATAQNNVYYWANGKQMIATGGAANRQEISYSQIPEEMRNAVISAENKSFETDRGIDPMGIARAFYNMAKGGETQGGSTITQQYVKNSRLSQEQTLSRKFEELFITLKVGKTESKQKIMAGYLNISYYGRGASGLQAAARTYYDKDATDLNASECAFLATLLKGATYYDPAGAPEIDRVQATAAKNKARAVKRWRWILDEEVKDGRLSQAERAKYTEFPMPKPPKQNAQLGGQTGYLVDLARKNFLNTNPDVTPEELSRGGYEIYTTFDQKKVNKLNAAVKKVYDNKIDAKKRPGTDTHVQFGGASVDPKTGAIRAIYGGQDATTHYTDNADTTGAQVGSTFKPFVLAAAMQYGRRDPKLPEVQDESQRKLVSPKSVYNADDMLKIKKYNGEVWTAKNGKEWLQSNDGHESRGNITLREAMQWSANSPYVQLGMDVGTDKVKDAAVAAGLRDDASMANSTVPSFSIGTSQPSAIRMAGAYGTFATSGMQNDPYSVSQAKFKGEVIYQHEKKSKRAFPNAVADNVTDVLKNVVEHGTGTPARLPGRDVAGKTGTTDNNLSAWFVGYTPQLSTAISMYRYDDNEKHKHRKFEKMYGTGGEKTIHGASFPAQIWHDYMAEALKGAPVLSFPKPEEWGETLYGGGASSPSPTPSVVPSETPSSTPSTSPSPTPTPDPTDTCGTWDWKCQNNNGGTSAGTDTGGTSTGTTAGGTDTGGTGGTDTGTTTGSTTDGGTSSTGGNGTSNGNGNGNGGFFGGPAG